MIGASPLGRRDLLAGGVSGAAACSVFAAVPTRGRRGVLAPTPPMGWNSWNSFATTIDEAQARETAAIMTRELLPFGYDVFTIDIQWYEPGASSYAYAAQPRALSDVMHRLVRRPG